MTQVHVEPPLTPLFKIKYDGKSEKDFVKLKLCRDLTSSTLGLYKLKMSLFDNSEPEEIFLFMRNFNTTLAASGMLEAGAKAQYLCTLVHREALRQFDSFSADMESANPLDMKILLKGWHYPPTPPVNSLSKQKHAMRRGIRKQRG